MILNIHKQYIIRSLEDLDRAFTNAKQWLDANIHLYEHLTIADDLINEVLRDFFTEYKGTTSIIKTGNSIWIVTEYIIKFVVVNNKQIIPCNTKQSAEDMFAKLARIALKSNPVYQMYPQDRIDFSVLQNMVTSQNINLKLITTS